jgi:hypothetical protein
MSKAFEEIAREATLLTRQQKLDLASMLLAITEDFAEPEVSTIWEQEILARIRAVDEGRTKGAAFEDLCKPRSFT